jgi:hypothetical protein
VEVYVVNEILFLLIRIDAGGCDRLGSIIASKVHDFLNSASKVLKSAIVPAEDVADMAMCTKLLCLDGI